MWIQPGITRLNPSSQSLVSSGTGIRQMQPSPVREPRSDPGALSRLWLSQSTLREHAVWMHRIHWEKKKEKRKEETPCLSASVGAWSFHRCSSEEEFIVSWRCGLKSKDYLTEVRFSSPTLQWNSFHLCAAGFWHRDESTSSFTWKLLTGNWLFKVFSCRTGASACEIPQVAVYRKTSCLHMSSITCGYTMLMCLENTSFKSHFTYQSWCHMEMRTFLSGRDKLCDDVHVCVCTELVSQFEDGFHPMGWKWDDWRVKLCICLNISVEYFYHTQWFSGLD